MSGPAWRISFVFCLLMTHWAAGPVSAHALPGSTLHFSQNRNELQLTIRLPLEDLLLAAPGLQHLEDQPPGSSLSAAELADLSRYFADHLTVYRNAMAIPLTLQSATLLDAHDEHVGHYTTLQLQLNSDSPSGSTDSALTLIYDAVMHEVRNYRATVTWAASDGHDRTLSAFGYRPTKGRQQAILLSR